MNRVLLIALFIASSFALSFKHEIYLDATVFYNSQSQGYSLKYGIFSDGVAFGSFNDTLDVTGWGVLKIQTNNTYDDQVQMYAAGYLEGALTHERIYQNYLNIYQFFFSGGPPTAKLLEFLKVQDTWVRNQISGEFKSLPPYWQQVAFIVAQFDGLTAGYNDFAQIELGIFAFQLLNGVGDFLDLIPALDEEKRINWDELSGEELSRKLGTTGHCSALIKVPGDLSDLWAGHSSWFVFGAMNRIFKHYFFDLSATFVSAKKMSFSSYPGFLESLDDFYMMDNGIAMVQTTNSILNQTLYELVTPYALFAWQRVRLSNSMARNGMEWGQLFSEFNSGTYNNQYMVVDYNKFKQGEQLLDGILVVVEQIPGLVEYADVTDQLERGYWASYNVPYFERIYNLSGYPEAVSKQGWAASYQMAPRAKIFRRDQGTVVDLPSFQAILRYNNYKNDPYSGGDPGNAICSRFDLETSDPGPFGCYDTKVTSYSLFQQMQSYAINGPTTSHGIPAFSWTEQNAIFNSTSHLGMPNTFDFSFEFMNPEW